MSLKPELEAISLCERVLQDLFRRDAVTLVNVHNGVSSQAFPTMVPVLYAFAQLRAHPDPFTYQFKVLNPEGVLVSQSSSGQVEGLVNPNGMHKVISVFSGLLFPTPGVYRVVLEVDGVEIGSIPYEVEHIVVNQPAAV
ncbi:MAG: hypothetical protein E6Q25_04575 [Acinetobacter sp.]|nr:MAG: hypothetical protein E6Q25_04575 [Acinetobacter sp.]